MLAVEPEVPQPVHGDLSLVPEFTQNGSLSRQCIDGWVQLNYTTSPWQAKQCLLTSQ